MHTMYISICIIAMCKEQIYIERLGGNQQKYLIFFVTFIFFFFFIPALIQRKRRQLLVPAPSLSFFDLLLTRLFYDHPQFFLLTRPKHLNLFPDNVRITIKLPLTRPDS